MGTALGSSLEMGIVLLLLHSDTAVAAVPQRTGPGGASPWFLS